MFNYFPGTTSSSRSFLPGAESANPRACAGKKNEMVGSRPSKNLLITNKPTNKSPTSEEIAQSGNAKADRIT